MKANRKVESLCRLVSVCCTSFILIYIKEKTENLNDQVGRMMEEFKNSTTINVNKKETLRIISVQGTSM